MLLFSGIKMNFSVKLSDNGIDLCSLLYGYFLNCLVIICLKFGLIELVIWENDLIVKKTSPIVNFEILLANNLTKKFTLNPVEGSR